MTALRLLIEPFAVERIETGWKPAVDGNAHPKLLEGFAERRFRWPRRVRKAKFAVGKGRIIIEPEVIAATGEIPTVANFRIDAEPGAVLVGEFLYEEGA